MTPDTTHLIRAGDATLCVEDRGTGPAIVFLHGFALDMRMWDEQVATLAGDWRVVRFDLRGFGRSSRPVAGQAYAHAGDLIALLDVLGIERPLIVGLSLGSNVALHACLAWPGRVRGAVLASPSLPGMPWRWGDDRPREAAGAIAAAQGVEAAKAFWGNHMLFASALERADIAARLALMTRDYSGWHWTNRDPQEPLPAMPQRLPSIQTPLLVLSGGRDIEAYREIAEIIVSGTPRSQFQLLLEAGHLMNMEAPEAFDAAVARFAASLL